ncbi:MAG: hypothetical protein LBI67_01675 [Treponema sp.]|jgi:hypothetical protein|nr:hypothetical protein [Treponema sp.]
MVKMNITMDNDILQQLQTALARFGEGSLPGVSMAMRQSAGLVRGTWQGFARGGSLPGIENLKRPSGKYARSIKIDRKGPFDYEIYSDAEVAGWIENGTEELDMKTTHPFGPRSRISKKGVPYLIVPFRWGTPGRNGQKRVGFRNIIPEQIYKQLLISRKNKFKFQASKVTASADTSDNLELNYNNHMVGVASRAKYEWGDRVFSADVDSLTDGSREDHFADGMVKMEGQNGKAAGYLTFRIISAAPGATGWIKPAMRARPVTRAVAGVTQDTVNEIIGSAVREELGL